MAESRLSGVVTWHALAELWSVLTRLPGPVRPTPDQALQLVRRVQGVFDVLSLEPAVYHEALQRCTERSFSSGVVFDALHLIAAERASVDALVTFNGGRFPTAGGSYLTAYYDPSGPACHCALRCVRPSEPKNRR